MFDLGLSDLDLPQGQSNARILKVLHKVILLPNIKVQSKYILNVGIRN